MKILVVQEADWMDVGVHDSHHIFERLQRNGHEVKVINHEFRWRKKQRNNRIFSPRKVEKRSRVISQVSVEVITPAYLRLFFFDYISVVINHRREISRQIREYSPDIIIGLGIFNSYFSNKMARKNKIAFAYYILDELHKLIPNRLLSLVSRLIESKTIKCSNDVIVTSVALREYVLAMGAREETIHYVPHGFEKSSVHEQDRIVIRKQLKIEDNDTVLLFMGWLYDFSGLVELTNEIIRTGKKNLKMLVIGKGDIEQQLNEIANGKGRDVLIMTGWVPFNDLFNYMNAADIFIMPFKNVDLMQNSVPIKIIEYLAAGKPVISTPLNGIVKEFGQNGGIIYANEPSQFISAIDQIEKENSFSDLGLKALHSVENREWEYITNMFEKILLDAVNKTTGC